MSGFDFPPLPFILQIILFASMGLGFTWAILVWLVNFPPRTWNGSREQKVVTREETRWKNPAPIWGQKKKSEEKNMRMEKLTDKLSKFATLVSTSEVSTKSGDRSEPAMTTGIMDENRAQSARKRNVNQPSGQVLQQAIESTELQQLPLSPAIPPWQQQLPHDTQPIPSSTPLSPQNPYLPARPLRPRSSADYLAAHTAFFTSPSNPATSAPLSTPSTTSKHFPFEDIAALEAQTTLPSQRRVHSDSNIGGGMRGKKRWSGANFLDVVESTVNKAVDKIAKWADDAGGEEGLLLPLGKRNKLR